MKLPGPLGTDRLVEIAGLGDLFDIVDETKDRPCADQRRCDDGDDHCSDAHQHAGSQKLLEAGHPRQGLRSPIGGKELEIVEAGNHGGLHCPGQPRLVIFKVNGHKVRVRLVNRFVRAGEHGDGINLGRHGQEPRQLIIVIAYDDDAFTLAGNHHRGCDNESVAAQVAPNFAIQHALEPRSVGIIDITPIGGDAAASIVRERDLGVSRARNSRGFEEDGNVELAALDIHDAVHDQVILRNRRRSADDRFELLRNQLSILLGLPMQPGLQLV